MKKSIIVGIFSLFATQFVFAESDAGKFKVFNDEELAGKYAIILVQDDSIMAKPERLLYRMARSDDGGIIKIAYHVVWPFEQDNRKGFWSWWTRITYTGGLKMQKIMYGPGDVEAIEMTINAETGKIDRVFYETADYDRKGNVIHVEVEKEGDEIPPDPRLVLRVVSWNHMFDLVTGSDIKECEPRYELDPEYFTEELWDYYSMTKEKETPLKKNRAHFKWEVEE